MSDTPKDDNPVPSDKNLPVGGNGGESPRRPRNEVLSDPSCEETFTSHSAGGFQTHGSAQHLEFDPDEEGDGAEIIKAWFLGDSEFRYVLTDLIAQGGGGEVWEGQHLVLNRIIAAKRPHFSWHVEARKAAELSGEKDVSGSRHGTTGDSPKLRAFLREAMVGAVLEHPNILPVYDLGRDMDGSPLIIMRLVRGNSWNRIISEDWDKLTVEDFLYRHIPIFIQVANAVAYAHSRGIIHRDIKPSQIMIGDYGEVQLMDWGLSVILDPDTLPDEWKPQEAPLKPTITQASNPAGTPAYMAPEQTTTSTEGLGPWTDVFLLGATLFYLLAGKPPYSSETTAQAVKKASSAALPSFHQIAGKRTIPTELEDLARQAMTPDWKQRRITALQFVKSLERFLSGYTKRNESIQITNNIEKTLSSGAKTYREFTSNLTMLVKARGLWSANPKIDPLRHKIMAMYAREALGQGDLNLALVQAERLPEGKEKDRIFSAIAVEERRIRSRDRQRRLSFVGLSILFLGLLFASAVAISQWSRAEEELKRARSAELQARESEIRSIDAMEIAKVEAYFSGIGFAAHSIREGNPEKALDTLLYATPEKYRQWEWGALMAQLNADDATIVNRAVAARRATFHSSISPDDRYMAVSQQNGWVVIWDLETLEIVNEWQYGSRGFWCVEYSPDGDRLLLAGLDGVGAVIDAQTGRTIFNFEPVREESPPILRGVAWSPDGTRFATSGNTTPVSIFDGNDGTLLNHRRVDPGTYDLHWSPDGSHLVVGARMNTPVLILDGETLETIHELTTDGTTALSVEYSRSGDLIAVGTNSGFLGFFDASDGTLLREIRMQDSSVRSLSFTKDDSLLAIVTSDGQVHLYDPESGHRIHGLVGAQQMEKLRFFHGSNQLVGTTFDTIKIWNIDRIHPRRVTIGPTEEILAANPLPIRLPGFPTQRMTIWGGYETAWLPDHPEHFFQAADRMVEVQPRDVSFNFDRTLRAEVGYESRDLRIYRGNTDEVLEQLLGENEAITALFSPDGRYLAVPRRDTVLEFYDVGTWQVIGDMTISGEGGDVPFSLAFSRDGKHLAVGYGNGQLIVYNMEEREIVFRDTENHPLEKPIASVIFSRDGSLVGTAASEEIASIFETETGRLVSQFEGHSLNVLAMDISPDNTRAISVGMDDHARVWDVKTGREIFSLYSSRSIRVRLMGVGFTDDGRGAFVVNNLGRLMYFDTLMWDEFASGNECLGSREILHCLEIFKREMRLPPRAAASPILW